MMPPDATIRITIDPSLLEHVKEQLATKKYPTPPEEAIASLVSAILDHSLYSTRAQKTGKREVRISYHIRPFSQPIFE
jgi:hypothetical protein